MARRRQLHAALEGARAQPHERDAVAMLRVHVRLHLEHEAGDFLVLGRNGRGFGGLRTGRRRMAAERVDQLGDTEVLQRGAEIDGRQVAVAIRLAIEFGIAGLGQLDLFGDLGGQRRRVVHLAVKGAAIALGAADLAGGEVENAFEQPAHADRPAHRCDVERQDVGDLIEQFEGRTPLAVDLVDEGDDRHRAQAADFEQLARLRLDTARRVDDHHGRIDRGQGAIGVFREILVPRRVEQVEGHAVLLERHHRGSDRDAALLLDLHPVRPRPPVLPARLDLARQVDRAAEIEQLFGQRGLTGVRVRDDREGTAGGSHGRLCQIRKWRIRAPEMRACYSKLWHKTGPCQISPPLQGRGRGWGASASLGFEAKPHPNPSPEGERLRDGYPASVTVICMTFSPPTGTTNTPGLSKKSPSYPSGSAMPCHGSTQT